MSQLLKSPNFIVHRVIPLNPLVPDVADPANTPPTDGVEARGFTHAVVYWFGSAGLPLDTDTMTFRIIGFDYQSHAPLVPPFAWTRIRTVTLRLQERVIVPLVGQALYVRVDAEATAATQAEIRVAGFTPKGNILSQADQLSTLLQYPIDLAIDSSIVGVVATVVASIYIPAAGILSTESRVMLGTQAGGTGTLRLRNFTTGILVPGATWSAAGAGLQSVALAAATPIPAIGWYDVELVGDAAPTTAISKGMHLEF